MKNSLLKVLMFLTLVVISTGVVSAADNGKILVLLIIIQIIH